MVHISSRWLVFLLNAGEGLQVTGDTQPFGKSVLRDPAINEELKYLRIYGGCYNSIRSHLSRGPLNGATIVVPLVFSRGRKNYTPFSLISG